MPSADERLLADVEDFSSSNTRPSEEAWSRINGQPQAEMRARLSRLSASLPERDGRRVFIAFALCHLGEDYSANKEIVVSSLTKKPVYERVYGDWAADLVIRLARRGDKSLLPHLFASANWSDGAMASDLSGFFTEELKSEPDVFLSHLEGTPPAVRQKVYELFDGWELSDQDRQAIKAYLKSVAKTSDAGPPDR